MPDLEIAKVILKKKESQVWETVTPTKRGRLSTRDN